ncbi:peptidoglycan recognition protein family protein [Streptomyces sp. NPDC002513]
MVPPGGTAHIAQPAGPAESGVMRVLPRARPVRPPCLRIPGSALLLLGALPGFAASLTLMTCPSRVEQAVTALRPHPVEARSAVLHAAPRPRIMPRTAWARGGRPNQPPPRYDDKVIAVFVHHTASPNRYDCADVPRIIRALYAGQIGYRRWDDIGYNFLVDRCGRIYEGRAGGTERPVTGAHTQGFNHRTAGIAAIGTFTAGVPVPRAMTEAIAALAAWKLGLADIDPRTKVRLVSSNGKSRYKEGATVLLPALAGHKDGYATNCPGAALSALLPAIRDRAAHLQGRR